MRYPVNDNWLFTPFYDEELRWLTADTLPDTLERVRIPHTTAMMQANCSPEEEYQRESAYLHILTPPVAWQGRRVQLQFGAAAHQAEVFLNGVSLCTHSCGYTAFTADLTDHLRFGGRMLHRAGPDPRYVPPAAQPVQGLYLNPQTQRLPKPAHHRHRARSHPV